MTDREKWAELVAETQRCLGSENCDRDEEAAILYAARRLEAAEEVVRAAGGKTGKGHILSSGGRTECPECHHPAGAPWHTDDCRYGAAIARWEEGK